MTRKFQLKKTYLLTLIIIILFTALTIVTFLYLSARLQIQTDDKILARISKIISLPKEKPSFITLDENNLVNLKTRFPDFYQEASAGDKILQYQDRALLFRPKTNQIINVFASGNGVFDKKYIINPLLVAFRYNTGDEERVYALKSDLEKQLPVFSHFHPSGGLASHLLTFSISRYEFSPFKWHSLATCPSF